jgi:hypothetical protein
VADFPDDNTIRREIRRIQNGLKCTEAEAFFTLRSFLYPPPEALFEEHPESAGGPPRHSRKRALHYTRDILSRMEECQYMAERGHFSFFLGALELCGKTGFPLPLWVSERIGKASVAYRRHLVATVDEAFGAETPPHYKDEKHWERFCASVDIYNRCLELERKGTKKRGEGFEDDLFNIVAEEWQKKIKGIGRSTIRSYYYAHKNIVNPPPPDRRRGRPPGKKGDKKNPRE